MKKLKYLFLLLSLVPSAIFGQIFTNGDGSQANPYSGTLLASSTLSGTVYINGDIIIDSYKLTISPGTTIMFDVSLIFPSIYVSSTGAIDAQGTAGNVITFTSAAGAAD